MDIQLHYALLTAAMAGVMVQCSRGVSQVNVESPDHDHDREEHQEPKTQDPSYQYRHQIAYSKRMSATDPEFKAKRNALKRAWYQNKKENDPDFALRMREKSRKAYERRKGSGSSSANASTAAT